ncbi:putative phosphopantetheinyl transferase [Aureobasidium sp. EXF-3400]|nr:putative phosphopantetheinyl transferase [Aureobasidium sp. EXF-12344]KAI4769683.1 putative phosphopantetheinyl transferase [Aureobasidium sp. EXF-3400]
MTESNLPGLTCWLIDTRSIWLGQNIKDAASEILHLLSPDEQDAVLRKMFIADAKMSLASALLKRLYISRALSIPWKQVTLARKGDPKHGKPCAVLPSGSFSSLDFNVSHQAGLVSLIGWNPCSTPSESVQVGTDIVCVNERDDYRTIDTEGFDAWIDIYTDIFSEAERWDMKYNIDYITLLNGVTIPGSQLNRLDRCIIRNLPLSITLPTGESHSFSSDLIIESKLRRFYAFFCYKEAFIKLTGEALLAPWLTDLEFQGVKSPLPGTQARCSTHGTWGEKVTDVEVVLHGEKVEDVKMSLQAYEEDFMLSTAVKAEAIEQMQVPEWKKLDLESDVLVFAT